MPGFRAEIPLAGQGSKFVDTSLTLRTIDRLIGYQSLANHFGFNGEVILLAGVERQVPTILEWDPY
jgi:hypothetical protein